MNNDRERALTTNNWNKSIGSVLELLCRLSSAHLNQNFNPLRRYKSHWKCYVNPKAILRYIEISYPNDINLYFNYDTLYKSSNYSQAILFFVKYFTLMGFLLPIKIFSLFCIFKPNLSDFFTFRIFEPAYIIYLFLIRQIILHHKTLFHFNFLAHYISINSFWQLLMTNFSSDKKIVELIILIFSCVIIAALIFFHKFISLFALV